MSLQRFLSCDPESVIAPVYNDTVVVCADLSAAGFFAITAEQVTKLMRSSSAR
jgi:hypothetical protein